MAKLWWNIFNGNVYSPPALSRLQGPPTGDTYPFLIELRNVNLKRDIPSGSQYQLTAYLYDAQNRRFFGRAWKGRWIKDAPTGQQKVTFSEVIYFHIPYKDNSILCVIELIQQRIDSVSQDHASTLAWTVLRMMPTVTRNDIPQAQIEMYQGSAQVLAFLAEPVESDVKLKKSGISLHYGLRSHPSLRPAYDFVPINTIIGGEESIPGLESSLDGPILTNPVAKLQSLAVIHRLSIHLGQSAKRIENEVCEYMNKERLLKDNRLFDGEVMDILERRVRVGVHNGWTYLHEPYIFHLSFNETDPDSRSLRRKPTSSKQYTRSSTWDTSDPYSDKGRLYLRNRIELNEMITDPGIAVVFYYQLLVALQSTKPNPPAKVVTVAWGAWSPFSDSSPSTKPVGVTLPLHGGPTRNPDGVLCFTDFYSLSETNTGARTDRASRTGMNAITVEFHFDPHRKKNEEQPVPHVMDDGQVIQPHPTQQSSIASHGPVSPNNSSRQPTPAPPPRTGRAPLPSAIKRPGAIVDRVQPSMQLFPMPYYWPVQGPSGPMVPSLPFPAGQMTQLPVSGPVQAPLIPIQQQHWRPSDIPRNIMAMIDQAKFQPVVDRHCEVPQLVDIFDTGAFSLDSDIKDPLVCNEIVFQFLGLARLLLTVPEHQPLSADQSTYMRIFRRVDPAGLLVKFVVDPEYLKPGEREYFLEYLYSHQLSIDVWNGDSLMLIGSCLLPLRQLCRRNRESVQSYCQLPVVTTDIVARDDEENEELINSSVQPSMVALLYLKVACSGYPSAAGLDALLRMNGTALTRNPAVITHSLHKDTSTGSRTVDRIVLRPRPLANRDVVIRPVLVNARRLQDMNDDSNDERVRKLERFKNIRQIEGYASSRMHGPLSKDSYLRDIQMMKHLRDEMKEKTIISALFQSITTFHSIFPTLGSAEFMEFVLSNPYNESITLAIEISDVEMKVVTNIREWQYFKSTNNLFTPMEPSMFSVQPGANQTDKETIHLYLRPKETVHVPLKYQSFSSIDYPEFKEAYHKPSVRVLLPSKTIKTIFRKIDNGEVVSALILQVELQPHIVHQSFRFYYPEYQFLSKYIRIQPEAFQGSQAPVECVYCTDPTVICELRTTSSAGVPQDVFLKVASRTSPVVRRFNIMLYADQYLSKPMQIWQIHVHSVQKVDLSTTQGNRVTFPIVIKGDKANRMVRCFTSCPSEASVHPSAPFILDPGTTVDVQIVYKPLMGGERTLQITAVDVELRELVKSWFVYCNVKPAVITKAYQVVVQCGQAGRTLNKKVSYTNSYNVKKKFRVYSSREDLMTIKEPSILELEGGSSGVIGLRFNSHVTPRVTEILLFITDEQEKLEDTYGIKAVFVT